MRPPAARRGAAVEIGPARVTQVPALEAGGADDIVDAELVNYDR